MAEVIDPTKLSGSRVKFGATVTIEDTESGEKQRYTIVGEHEADIKKGRISIGAPVARALIGKEIGDTVTVQSPKGKREYEVTESSGSMSPRSRRFRREACIDDCRCSLSLIVVGCKQGEGERCQVDDDCDSGLVCNKAKNTCAVQQRWCSRCRSLPADAPRTRRPM